MRITAAILMVLWVAAIVLLVVSHTRQRFGKHE